MIDTKPPIRGGKCTDTSICLSQENFMRSNLGNYKIKYDHGISYCYFCEGDLRKKIYMERIRTK